MKQIALPEGRNFHLQLLGQLFGPESRLCASDALNSKIESYCVI